MTVKPRTTAGLSATAIRWVAMGTMLVDHIAASLVDWASRYASAPAAAAELDQISLALHCVGRLSFPLFVFLLVEGFAHTRDRSRYLGRLVVLAAVSELPFDLALFLWGSQIRSGVWWSLEHQNAVLTLAIGLATIWALDKIRKGDGGGGRPQRIICCAATVLAGCLLAWLVRCDYSWYGVLAIVAGYLARAWGRPALCLAAIVAPLCAYSPYEAIALLDCALVAAYDGSRGNSCPRWLAYGFYPAHLAVLGVIRVLFVLPN